MKHCTMAALLALWLPAAALATAPTYRIDHLEPPLWWIGMHNNSLQLMVHGPQIADLEPALDYPGVRISAVTRAANKNYLWITLELAPDAAAGQLDLRFGSGQATLHYHYPLLARSPGSAQRRGFSSGDAIYQVMPDRYANGEPANDHAAGMRERADRSAPSGRHGGDLQGMSNHLDYIAALGFTTVWPTPLLESNAPAFSYHGYATTNHYRIDPRYGSNEDYRRFVTQARAHGLGVIQDVVLNHIGAHHWWMQDLPMPDWLTYQGRYVPTAHHRVALQDPYAAEADRRNFTEGWFVADMPDLNQANPYVATYLIQNDIWWIEYAGLSGLRVDTYSYSNTAFLNRWSASVMAEYPQLNLVGEEWSTLVPVVAHWQRGGHNVNGDLSHMPSMMDFPLADALRRALAPGDGKGPGLTALYETLSQDYLYPQAGQLVLFEGNHDMSRLYSELGTDDHAYRMALAVLATLPRIPQLYAGTEIQMTSATGERDDASYRRDFPGGWRGDAVNAFTGTGLSAQQAAAQAYVRRLFNWRKGAAVIHHGKMLHYGPEQNTYVYFRYDGVKKVMVAINNNATDTVLDTARFHEMLAGVHSGVDVISGRRFALDATVRLPARTALILEIE